jgi:hypothetical protein
MAKQVKGSKQTLRMMRPIDKDKDDPATAAVISLQVMPEEHPVHRPTARRPPKPWRVRPQSLDDNPGVEVGPRGLQIAPPLPESIAVVLHQLHRAVIQINSFPEAVRILPARESAMTPLQCRQGLLRGLVTSVAALEALRRLERAVEELSARHSVAGRL